MFFVYKSRCSGKVRTLPKEQHHVFISGLNEPRYLGVNFWRLEAAQTAETALTAV